VTPPLNASLTSATAAATVEATNRARVLCSRDSSQPVMMTNGTVNTSTASTIHSTGVGSRSMST
jgi:hypothetical protein